MSATEVNTNVAQEMNITHRRGDSFELQVSVTDTANNSSFDLSQAQLGTNPFPLAGIMPVYQAKMTIKKRNSQHEALNIYTYYWQDVHGENKTPTLIKTGHYYGEKIGGNLGDGAGNQSPLYAGIYLLESTGASSEENIFIKAPNSYINFDPGQYIYDLQIRRKDEYSTSDNGAIYTTWLFGKFTLIDDVTEI
jgi:hypothetical protein|tara:strand:- start:430 stop:1008 length:579 start_codon:yes stop_codon:yes gene_type:complete